MSQLSRFTLSAVFHTMRNSDEFISVLASRNGIFAARLHGVRMRSTVKKSKLQHALSLAAHLKNGESSRYESSSLFSILQLNRRPYKLACFYLLSSLLLLSLDSRPPHQGRLSVFNSPVSRYSHSTTHLLSHYIHHHLTRQAPILSLAMSQDVWARAMGTTCHGPVASMLGEVYLRTTSNILSVRAQGAHLNINCRIASQAGTVFARSMS